MKKLFFIFCIAVFSGCSSIQTLKNEIKQPELLKQHPLPLIPQKIYKPNLELISDMLIAEDGSVQNAKLLKSSGDKEWDALAVQSMLKWKFTSPMYNGKKIKLLIRRKIKIQFAEPEMMNLAEIVFNDLRMADSVYEALSNGASFDEMVSKYSISSSKVRSGIIGEVNIQNYSRDVAAVLSKLKEDKISKPIKYGEYYIIFKRLRKIESVNKKEIIKIKENIFNHIDAYGSIFK